MSHPQDELYNSSLSSPEAFWRHQASFLDWHKPPTTILKKYTKALSNNNDNISHPHWEWFPDGELNTCYNCVDRHVRQGHGDQVAIYYDSPVTKNTKQTITYRQLLDDVQVFAAVLRDEGVRKGDTVLVYMPMHPAVITGLLAIARLGAIHAVVFGGFAPAALAQRIVASRPVVILTASCGIDGNKPPIPYQAYVTEAAELAAKQGNWKTPRTIVWQRPELAWHPLRREKGERNWNRLARSAALRGRRVRECVPVKATDGAYVIYTSGTTGLPKGVVREVGGHAVGLHLSMRAMFGIQGPGDVVSFSHRLGLFLSPVLSFSLFFCRFKKGFEEQLLLTPTLQKIATLSDIGWVVSHSYTLYGPLLVGAATVVYEGKPVGTPDASAFWRMIQEYKVNAMFTAPTALRAIRKDDPDNKHLTRIGEQGGLRSLRAMFLAGERSEPAIITMYEKLLAKYGSDDKKIGGGGARVIDNWWSSESGSPISGISMAAHVAAVQGGAAPRPPLAIKPGSAGKPMPGFDVRVVDDEGNEVEKGRMGNIVLKMPLAPTAFRTLWEDEKRFYSGYLKRFEGKWLDTGDAGMIDPDGYVHIMARSGKLMKPRSLL